LQFPPIAHHIFAFHKNVRIEIDDFLPQLPIEAGHDRDDQNQHGDT